MQVKGENTFLLNITGQQNFQEASVKREGGFGFFGLFGSNKITIDAGEGDDNISVKKLGQDQYQVTVNGQAFVLSEDEMKNLTIKGGAGNDNIYIDDSVDIAINVDGGAGNDNIVNTADGTKIDGGDGNDNIISIANFTEILGGAGRDNIVVAGHFNEVHGDNKPSIFDLLFGTNKNEEDQIRSFGFNDIND